MNKAGARAMAAVALVGLALAVGCVLIGDWPLGVAGAVIHTAALGVAVFGK